MPPKRKPDAAIESKAKRGKSVAKSVTKTVTKAGTKSDTKCTSVTSQDVKAFAKLWRRFATFAGFEVLIAEKLDPNVRLVLRVATSYFLLDENQSSSSKAAIQSVTKASLVDRIDDAVKGQDDRVDAILKRYQETRLELGYIRDCINDLFVPRGCVTENSVS